MIKTWATKDIFLAAYCSVKGQRPTLVGDEQGAVVWMVFDNHAKAKEMKAGYYSGAEIPAMALVQEIRRLKQAVYECLAVSSSIEGNDPSDP